MARNPNLLSDIFTAAFEGGINYWARIITYRWQKPGLRGQDLPVDQLQDLKGFGGVIEDTEDEMNQSHVVDIRTIRRGLALLRAGKATFGGQPWDNGKKVLGRIIAEDYDASDADIVVQVGLFGDVRYG